MERYLANIPGDILPQLHRADAALAQWRSQGSLFGPNPPEVVQRHHSPLPSVEFDVAIGGGTLGIMVGTALAQQGWKVAVMERGALQGREQEWNTSRQELEVLITLGLLSEAELEAAIASEFNPNRLQFHNGQPVFVSDILNIGVSPQRLIASLKQQFLNAGGTLLEQTAFKGASIHPNGVKIEGSSTLTSRLFLDAMGHRSAIVAQARRGEAPQGLCLVVGTCAQGYPSQDGGDLMVSCTDTQDHRQYFWEAFPAADGRTTYLFTYSDLQPGRPTLGDLFADYFRLLPSYQSVSIEQLQFQRALFGVFPSYRRSPLAFPWPRMMAIGDSSSTQSPLSFGGFGAMLRHLNRLCQGLGDALRIDALDCQDLQLLQPYQPNLSVTWLFQNVMSPPLTRTLPPAQINHLLDEVFQTMVASGPQVLSPFLQDVVQWQGLTQTLLKLTLTSPQLIPPILNQVGIPALLSWLPHYGALTAGTALCQLLPVLKPWSDRLPPRARYRWQRRFDAWCYGAGLDHLVQH